MSSHLDRRYETVSIKVLKLHSKKNPAEYTGLLPDVIVFVCFNHITYLQRAPILAQCILYNDAFPM